jgi:hypothetical protein
MVLAHRAHVRLHNHFLRKISLIVLGVGHPNLTQAQLSILKYLDQSEAKIADTGRTHGVSCVYLSHKHEKVLIFAQPPKKAGGRARSLLSQTHDVMVKNYVIHIEGW